LVKEYGKERRKEKEGVQLQKEKGNRILK